MNEIERAIDVIENDEVMECDCDKCTENRWAFELALAALREKQERMKIDAVPVVRGLAGQHRLLHGVWVCKS